LNEPFIIQLYLYGTATFVLLVAVIFAMIIAQKKRKYKYANEKKEREHQFKNELLNTQIELQEHLLNEVSREIHDNVAQVLSLVKMNQFSISKLSVNEKALDLTHSSSRLIDQAIDDLRAISHKHNAGHLRKIGLKEALHEETRYVNNTREANVNLELFGEYYSLAPEAELLAYRIAQEALQNCLKHAKAKTITVALVYERHQLTLNISDNGVGFDTGNNPSGGIGITNMKHRAHLLDAALNIMSHINRGTTIEIIIPRKHERED